MSTSTSSTAQAPTVPRSVSIKLVMLGESAVGKSSIALRFCRNEFSDWRESTIGAAFLTQQVKVGEDTVKIELWDTAGQERYRSLAPMYFRNANCAIVVYDLTSLASLEKARSWITELQRQADPGIIICLAGNKLDLAETQRQVLAETAKKLADEQGLMFCEVSAKTGEGVEEMFQSLASKIPLDSPTIKPRSAGGGTQVRGGVDLSRSTTGSIVDGCSC